MVRWTVNRIVKGWTDPKKYAICDGKKERLRLKDKDEADEVCKLLNEVAPKKPTTRKTKTKKTSKETKPKKEDEVI